MKNITLSLDPNLLDAGRKYAKTHYTSLNALIRQLLAKIVLPESQNWMENTFQLMDKTKANSKGKKWHREDLYDV